MYTLFDTKEGTIHHPKVKTPHIEYVLYCSVGAGAGAGAGVGVGGGAGVGAGSGG